ncbi:glycoside hydrolase family 2 TIM barrel-domain containing protein [Asticcacaulis sp. DXS10W]|uniref:Glycoside hydrolase family 2 TIM barrel-domain containing protein n=1 Tax=Asticcacaulis currens TaxID=2984210 RepID=A0ABT5IIN3_9CAUL|nr:glycoside hydrolase family 2 TIM barrel-domain containing protein [Asticcacaulis currens]MDC7695817.1 glycoside hydrolase family 2 TIM barrel-domain containing protein [Asticcacaulis currens]
MLKRYVVAMAALMLASSDAKAGETVNFDAGWTFAKGDIEGAESVAGGAADWKPVTLPHDWAIAGPFDQTAASTGSGGWLPTGVAWYRKSFALTPDLKGKRVFIELGGVMERGGVWINGMHVGHRPNGYSSVRYEITDHLKDGDNVIAVRADTSAQPASRWYAGGGIYRHVKLIVTGDIHVDGWGTFVTTPKIDAASAAVKVESALRNQSKTDRTAHLEITLTGPDGKPAGTFKGTAQTLPAGRVTKLSAEGALSQPKLWDIGQGNLYTAEVKVVADTGEVLETDRSTFGVRTIAFRADTGFWLNGRNIKLKGTAIHADGGAFGMAVPLSFYERRLRGLQALGVNAIRTAHHPFSPEFLDLCDRLGLVVMNEAFDMWTVAKSPKDYHLFFTDWSSLDARDFAQRDRNHPSVIIWSIGNEIHDTPYPIVAKSILTRLQNIFHEEDPSRPVTMALFRPNTTGDYTNGLADLLDVVGQNYRENELIQAHKDKPTRKIIGTENSKNRSSWVPVRDYAPYAGMFLWTGADYLGEADRAGWPLISNPSGLVDRTDVVKPIGWERASWWAETPVVRIGRRVTEVIDTSELPTMVGVAMPQPKGPGVLNDWTPQANGPHSEKVEIVANTPTVELFLNGKSLGRKPKNADDSAIRYDVPFAPGTIRAVGYDAAGKVVAQDELKTASAPVAVRLTAEQTALKPGFDHVGFVRAEVVDKNGVRVPDAAQTLSVTVEGAGQLAAFDNGSPTDSTVFSSPSRKAWNGRALVMVRATDTKGKIRVTVSGEGLKPATVTLDAKE